MNRSRLYNDGLDPRTRGRLRHEAWRQVLESKPTRPWREKYCAKCDRWNRRDRPEEWCECLLDRGSSQAAKGPSIQVFRPFFHPNLQPGGTWIESRQAYRECCRLNHKEPAG